MPSGEDFKKFYHYFWGRVLLYLGTSYATTNSSPRCRDKIQQCQFFLIIVSI